MSRNDEPKRHTHATINGIEDIEAQMMNVEEELKIAQKRIGIIWEILRKLRRGPHEYQRGNQCKPKITVIRGDDDEN